MKMDELRAHARTLGLDGADELHKPELLAKVKAHHYAQAHGGEHRDGSGGGASAGRRPTRSELSGMKLDELRAHARRLRIDGADELHKPELLARVKEHHLASELSSMKLGELRAHARTLGLDGADELHKPELLAKVKDHHGLGGGGASGGRRPTRSELSGMKLDELRAHARRLRIDGADELHKPELLARVKEHHLASELSSMKLGELRAHARKLGLDGADELHKPELLATVKDHHFAETHDGGHRPDADGGSTGESRPAPSAEQDHGDNATPDTPDAGETTPAAKQRDELPAHPPEPGSDGDEELHSPELLATVEDAPSTAEDGQGSPREETPLHAITGSEERLDVGTEPRETDRAGLGAHIVPGHQQVSVPAPREELITVEPEPIAEVNRDAPDDGPATSEEPPEVVLPEEAQLFARAAVPAGVVRRFGTETRTGQETVGTEIGQEELDVDPDGPSVPGR
ncbi:hypothetical protein GCM10023215_39010 [Pseudonocardia yuanmonensis]|uniref:Rho termination factor-like N-terminal domain-containing protein n=2 Tax=Pseudonocardia yuanmonensis TaxID=1095914 RepID=A0ABP8X1D9_9PSEU